MVVVSVTLPHFLRPPLSPPDSGSCFCHAPSLLAPSSLLEGELYSAASHEVVVGQGVRVLDEQTLRVTKTSLISTGLGLNLKVKKVYSNLRLVTEIILQKRVTIHPRVTKTSRVMSVWSVRTVLQGCYFLNQNFWLKIPWLFRFPWISRLVHSAVVDSVPHSLNLLDQFVKFHDSFQHHSLTYRKSHPPHPQPPPHLTFPRRVATLYP